MQAWFTRYIAYVWTVTKKSAEKEKKYLPNVIFCDKISFVSGDGGMADALDSGSSGSNPVRVQVPFSAFCYAYKNPWFSGVLFIFLFHDFIAKVITVITECLQYFSNLHDTAVSLI